MLFYKILLVILNLLRVLENPGRQKTFVNIYDFITLPIKIPLEVYFSLNQVLRKPSSLFYSISPG